MIGIYAPSGRMGKALKEMLTDIEYIDFDRLDLYSFCKKSNVVIDFSTPLATYDLCQFLIENNLSCPLVIGTTGLSADTFKLIENYSKIAPVFYAQNFSFGVYVQKEISKLAARLLDFDIEIFEAHHSLKKDAPSGTALSLGQAIAKARELEFDDVAVFNRTEQRKKNEIGFSSARGGGVIGDHTVHFYGPFEKISITHSSYSRNIYASGAIKAALWLVNKPSGFYKMEDLFIHD